jgi:hypothetical protein
VIAGRLNRTGKAVWSKLQRDLPVALLAAAFENENRLSGKHLGGRRYSFSFPGTALA